MVTTSGLQTRARRKQLDQQNQNGLTAAPLLVSDGINKGELAPAMEDKSESDESDQEESGSVEADSDESDEDASDGDSLDTELSDEIQREEQLAAIGQGEPEGEGEDSELHVYEVRQDRNGERVSLRTGTRSEMGVLRDRSYRACLVLLRRYRQNRDLDFTELRIQSPYLKKVLQDVIGAYPGVTLHTSGHIFIREPPMCLFHYRRELEAYTRASSLPIVKRHLNLLLGYVEKTLEQEIRQYEATFENQMAAASLEHQHLWMAYKPGELLSSTSDNLDIVSRMVGISKMMKPLFRSTEIDHWIINVERIEFHGDRMMWVPYDVTIPNYDGCRQMANQPIAPFRFHTERERVKRDLVARGRRYQQLAGVFHQSYNGPAKFFDPVNPSFVVTHSNVSIHITPHYL